MSRLNVQISAAALMAARACALVSALSAAVGVLNMVPAASSPLVSALCLAGLSFAVVFYLAVLMMTLSSQARLLVAMLMLGGSGFLLSSFAFYGLHPLRLVCIVFGLFLVVFGSALAASLILSSSVLIHDSIQTRRKL